VGGGFHGWRVGGLVMGWMGLDVVKPVRLRLRRC
jgi:hypothetical protein